MNPDKVTVTAAFNENKELVVTASYAGVELKEGVDYRIDTTQDAEGNVTVTLVALDGNFTGSISTIIAAKDNPNAPTKAPDESTKAPSGESNVKVAKAKIKSAKNSKKKSIVIQLKKAKNAKKYQIRYATNKKLKKAKTKTTTKLKITLKKLKKGKTYFIKVRGINGKVTGAWSKPKKVKVKK